MANDRSPDADFFANIQSDSPRSSRAKAQKKEKSSVRPVRKIKLPINLLPLGPLERNLYAGVAAIAIWYLLTNWNVNNYWYGDTLANYALEVVHWGISDFVRVSEVNSLGSVVVSGSALLFQQTLPTVVGYLVATTAAVLLLKTLGIIALRANLLTVAPIVLTSLIGIMIYSVVIVPPITSLVDALLPTYPRAAFRFDFPWGSWIDEVFFVVSQLIVPVGVAAVAWVPALAPEKE